MLGTIQRSHFPMLLRVCILLAVSILIATSASVLAGPCPTYHCGAGTLQEDEGGG
jgi:hypothetical protein